MSSAPNVQLDFKNLLNLPVALGRSSIGATHLVRYPDCERKS